MLEDLEATLAPARAEQLLPGGLPAADDEQHHRAGLLLWTALHNTVSLRTNKPAPTTWPPVQDMLVDLLVLHTAPAPTPSEQRAERQEITAVLARRTTRP